MALDRAGKKSAWWPLLFLWLAAHVVLLCLILGGKFLIAKTVMFLLLAGTAAWLLLGKMRAPSLPAPPGMDNEARAV
jgi:hypothetical protein